MPHDRDAWGAVFHLRQMIVGGDNVNRFLSKKGIGNLSRRDGLLWNYSMHHLHLRSNMNADGFAVQGDHLLFAIIAPRDAYFVDARPHPPDNGIEWVALDLLHIVHSNWPRLIEGKILHGVRGMRLTDREMHEVRRKNATCVIDIDGTAMRWAQRLSFALFFWRACLLLRNCCPD